ncbi:MAG: DUF1614 domain-containing protein [Planctomycetia bacterium]|nr:DUF1614 domain-containing protein [Planctomycetia bacterium]
MHTSSFHYLPLAPLFFLSLVLLLGVLIVILQIGILGYAYEKMGITRRAAYSLLFLSLLGAWVNIPVAELPGGRMIVTKEVNDGWWRYRIPVIEEWPGTELAINVGGAVIPTLLSIYLVVKNQIYGEAIVGVAGVAAVVHALATPVPQMGIAVPIFIPPIVSALVAVLLSREYAAPLAYVSGCMGTLVGADLLNLGKLAEVGGSIQSIGGAGTFDGVFLTGILAVLLAARPGATRPTRAEPPAPSNLSAIS